jgi:hypothetical protein
MLDAAALIKKHRGKGVLVDTNLLVLFLVGLVNPRRIGTFKRTESFLVDDFELLRSLISHFGPRLLATPHIWSQVSDLTDLKGEELMRVRSLMRDLVERSEEHFDAARGLVSHPVFNRLGLADAGIAAAQSTEVLILTADFPLYEALQQHGIESLNFNHVRPLGWR